LNDYLFGVRVIINGEPQSLSEGVTLADLLHQLQLNRRRIAVEVNREIVARELYDVHALTDGDEIEIVNFVGGG
jgi:thiamine biosynthesis protein ThiS